MTALSEHGIGTIDLVVVNLYPFRETAARPGVSDEDVIENIDIGGPSMLRSAAKNFASVWVLVDPSDYDAVASLVERGEDDAALRRRLAEKVYAHTASYDAAIAGWFAGRRGEPFPDQFPLAFRKQQSLRYGENPQQRAAFYVERPGAGLGGLKQLGGKELSFNNLLDLEGAMLAIEPFDGQPACAIIKHTTPCGLATGTDALQAYRKALACDPVSAFGSVIAFSVPVDVATADAVSSLFVECIVAPSFAEEAVELLGRKKNLRVLAGEARWTAGSLDYKRVRGGLLVQDRAPAPLESAQWNVVTKRAPTREEHRDLDFAWRAVASVKSNAIVLVREGATIGIGAGQMSRVDASFLAAHKARTVGHDTAGAALGSDAFFPFRDGIDQAAAAGVRAAADEHGIAMVFTGVRLFRH
jgi:phosphoribosylaminoimidazolecarboxamide formyltransferase/IMP cyclohydrolase